MHGEGVYVPKCTAAYSHGGRQKFRLFAYVIVPDQKRVIKKLAKLLKPLYLNQLIDANILAKLEAAARGCSFLKISQIHRKTPVLKSLFNKVAGP